MIESDNAADSRLGRIAVRIDFARTGELINAIRRFARVAPANLRGPNMVRLDEGGAL